MNRSPIGLELKNLLKRRGRRVRREEQELSSGLTFSMRSPRSLRFLSSWACCWAGGLLRQRHRDDNIVLGNSKRTTPAAPKAAAGSSNRRASSVAGGTSNTRTSWIGWNGTRLRLPAWLSPRRLKATAWPATVSNGACGACQPRNVTASLTPTCDSFTVIHNSFSRFLSLRSDGGSSRIPTAAMLNRTLP